MPALDPFGQLYSIWGEIMRMHHVALGLGLAIGLCYCELAVMPPMATRSRSISRASSSRSTEEKATLFGYNEGESRLFYYTAGAGEATSRFRRTATMSW